MKFLILLCLCFLSTGVLGQSVQFDRPGMGLSAYALPWTMSAVELGLPDGQWMDRLRTLSYNGVYRLGLGHGLEFQASTGTGADGSIAFKYAHDLSPQISSGTLLTTGQGTSLGQVITWTHGAWAYSTFAQLGRGYEVVGNASYACGSFSPYIEVGFLHDSFLGHSRVFGAGLALAITPTLQWDIQGRYLPTLHLWQAGWGLSFAF